MLIIYYIIIKDHHTKNQPIIHESRNIKADFPMLHGVRLR